MLFSWWPKNINVSFLDGQKNINVNYIDGHNHQDRALLDVFWPSRKQPILMVKVVLLMAKKHQRILSWWPENINVTYLDGHDHQDRIFLDVFWPSRKLPILMVRLSWYGLPWWSLAIKIWLSWCFLAINKSQISSSEHWIQSNGWW